MPNQSLITRLREAEGASRELDAEICAHLRRGIFPRVYDHINCIARTFIFDGREDWYVTLSPIDLPSARECRDLAVAVPKYTASLDAALALVAEVLPGWFFDMGHNYGTNEIQHGVFEGGELRYELNDPPFLAELISPTGGHFEAGHKSPAIALLIALLQAQGAQE
tara:strand:- start:19676 stop:20173 length:498 start_codon:yes stop_codon:yes gene_type:complete